MADIILQGQVTHVLEKRSGTTSKGATMVTWVSQNYVMDATDGQTEFKFAFDLFGEQLIALHDLHVGDRIRITVSLNAKQGKDGKWYNSFNVRNLVKL